MIIGNLGADPELRYAPSGDAVVSFSVATNKRWTDRDSGEKKERVEWHRCNAWGRAAETISQYMKKGSKIFIEGELQTRKWTDKEGVDRWTTEIRVFQFEFLDSASGSGRPPHPADAPPDEGRTRAPAEEQSKPQQDFDDDIPF